VQGKVNFVSVFLSINKFGKNVGVLQFGMRVFLTGILCALCHP
jgi:hypothetical protein